MLYEKIFQEFNARGLRYVIVGGIAVNLHGFSRATGDLAIAIALTDGECRAFAEACRALGYVPRLPVSLEDFADAEKRREWIEGKNMKVFSVWHPQKAMELVDVIIDGVGDFDAMFDNRVVMKSGTTEIPVAAIPDLIRLKEIAGRERDKIDVRALRKIQELKNG